MFQPIFGNSRTAPSFGTNKLKTQVAYSEQGVPLVDQCDWQQHNGPKHLGLLERLHRFLHWSKIAFAMSNIFSALLSLFMESVMFYVLYKFFQTKDVDVPGRAVGPWARNTQVWPTYMLAACSLVTLILAVGMLVALVCRSKRKEVFFSVAYAIAHIGSWVVVSVLYRAAKNTKDLWGWSCTAAAQEIQNEIGSDVLNFNNLCKLQGSSWIVSIVEVIVKVIVTVTSWLISRKIKNLKRVMATSS